MCIVPSICSKKNYCKGKIYEEVIHCLCYTGVTVSVIDGNLFEKLGKNMRFPLKVGTLSFWPKELMGTAILSIKGKVTLMVEFGSGTFTHLFYVIRINSDLILGLNFLSKHQASLDCVSALLHIQGQSINLSVSQPDSTIVLPKLPTQWNTLGGHVFAKVQDCRVPMLILNPSDQKIRILSKQLWANC